MVELLESAKLQEFNFVKKKGQNSELNELYIAHELSTWTRASDCQVEVNEMQSQENDQDVHFVLDFGVQRSKRL